MALNIRVLIEDNRRYYVGETKEESPEFESSLSYKIKIKIDSIEKQNI